MNISGDELLKQFGRDGFVKLPGDRLPDLCTYLEDIAVSTGQSAHLFLAEAIRAVWSVYEDDEQGITLETLQHLDAIVFRYMPTYTTGTPVKAAEAARELRNEISGGL